MPLWSCEHVLVYPPAHVYPPRPESYEYPWQPRTTPPSAQLLLDLMHSSQVVIAIIASFILIFRPNIINIIHQEPHTSHFHNTQIILTENTDPSLFSTARLFPSIPIAYTPTLSPSMLSHILTLCSPTESYLPVAPAVIHVEHFHLPV